MLILAPPMIRVSPSGFHAMSSTFPIFSLFRLFFLLVVEFLLIVAIIIDKLPLSLRQLFVDICDYSRFNLFKIYYNLQLKKIKNGFELKNSTKCRLQRK